MSQERVVRREVHQVESETAEPATVQQETVTERVETVRPAAAPDEQGVTNVNVASNAGTPGGVSINTSDGTQVNVKP